MSESEEQCPWSPIEMADLLELHARSADHLILSYSETADISRRGAQCIREMLARIAALEAEVAEVKRQRNNAENALDAALADAKRLREALEGAHAFIGVMFGSGADAAIPEMVLAPIGVQVKLGDLMRRIEAALSDAGPPAAPEGWRTMEDVPPVCVNVLCGRWLSPRKWFQCIAEVVPAYANQWVSDGAVMTLKPTHWRFLPAPPANGGERTEKEGGSHEPE